MSTNAKAPLIFDIAKGSFSDGPGVRTVVFFKGCPLRCVWCHNPESQRVEEEQLYFSERCIRCGRCEQGLECVAGARRPIGRYYDPNDLVDMILQDRPYYDATGGGVTFSGGEPLLFLSYLREVLPKLKQSGIHAAVQTSGAFDFERFREEIATYIDLVYYDLKIFDAEDHARWTGKDNRAILANLPRLIHLGIEVVPRIALIPAYTATEENLSALAAYLSESAARHVELLFYNPASEEKQRRLGRTDPGRSIERISIDEQQHWIRYFERCLDRGSAPEKRGGHGVLRSPQSQ